MKPHIIFEDDDIIIAQKAAEMLAIPDRFDHSKPSLSGELTKIHGKIFIVHRLDRETSGLIVFAKNEFAHRHLSMQFEGKEEVQKIYLALLDGVINTEGGTIEKGIDKHPTLPGKMIVSKQGKYSLTHYTVIEKFKHFSLVEADIKTGRTHQIRVHFQSIGYPLAIDAMYGRRSALCASDIKQRGFKLSKYQEEERPLMSRTTLHAHKLSFLHPSTNERVNFVSELPKDFSALIKQLQRWSS